MGKGFSVHSKGKYAGGIGKDYFRRPLRADARTNVPEYLGRFMKHDWYWGIGKLPILAAGGYMAMTLYSENYSNAAIDYSINKGTFF